MKKSHRLNVIVELNVKSEQKALEAFGEAQRQRQSAEQQLENLVQYRQDYSTQYQSITETGLNIKQLLEFRAFMSKLDKAIAEQKQIVLNIENQLKSTRSHWENQHQKTNSLQKVCDAAIKAELKAEDKKEQYEQDDRSTRMGRNGGIRNA